MQAAVSPKTVESSPLPPKRESDKCRDVEPVERAPLSKQRDEDTDSNDSSHVVVSNPHEETRTASPCTSDSLAAQEEFLEEVRLVLGTEVRKIVTEVVTTRVMAVVDGALQPLRKKMDEAHAAVQEHGRRLDAVAKGATQGSGERMTQLSQDVTRLSRQTEGVTTAFKQMQVGLQSIVTKVGELHVLQTQTSSTLETVVLSRATRETEPESAADKDKGKGKDRDKDEARHRSGSHSHAGSSKKHASATGTQSPEEKAARRERRRKREEEQKRDKERERAQSKDRAKDKDRDKRRGFFSLS